MSMFNEDQQSYMRYLDTIPPEHKCWCGWYKLGECPHCPAGKTCADKLETDPYWIKRLADLADEYGPILAAAIAVVQNPHFETCECRVCKLHAELAKKGLL